MKKIIYISLAILFLCITASKSYACNQDPIVYFDINRGSYFHNVGESQRFVSLAYDPDDGTTPNDGITQWKWYIDGNHEGSDNYIEWTFTDAGVHTVQLWVLDNDGQEDYDWDETVLEIFVSEAASPFRKEISEEYSWADDTLYIPLGYEESISLVANANPNSGSPGYYTMYPEDSPSWSITGPNTPPYTLSSSEFCLGESEQDKITIDGLTVPGTYTVSAYAGPYDDGESIDLKTFSGGVTGLNRNMVCYGGSLDVTYYVEPYEGWYPDYIFFGVEDAEPRLVADITSGIGSHTESVNLDDLPPGFYNPLIVVVKDDLWYVSPPQYQCSFEVVQIDLQTDSDNDGYVDTSIYDYFAEDFGPGVIIPKNLDGDNIPSSFRKAIVINSEPVDATLGRIKLIVGSGVQLWSAEYGGSAYGTSVSWPVSSAPSTFWVDGTTEGATTITAQYLYTDNTTVISQDSVKVLVTDPISRSPESLSGYVWLTTKESSDTSWDWYDANSFSDELEETGYDITFLEDTHRNDSDFEGCTFYNYKNLLLDCGAIHVISYGVPNNHLAVFGTQDACNSWKYGQSNMQTLYYLDEGCYSVYVNSLWLSENSSLNDNKAITHWAVGRSADSDSSEEDSVMAAAGGRWRIGYSGTSGFGPAVAANTVYHFFKRMNGTVDNGAYRTAGEAYDEGYYGENVVMAGNPWTTLCPAPMDSVQSIWPTSNPAPYYEDFPGWGCIIFDTYMNESNANLAITGDNIFSQSWSAETGHGKFVLGFKYYNEDTTEVSTNYNYCIGADGGNQMDANRIAPNDNTDPEGANIEWGF